MQNNQETSIEFRLQLLKEAIEKRLPTLAKALEVESDVFIIHQDAFAADYQTDEYMLLGMVIKYIGLTGKEINIIGKNGDTLGKSIEHQITQTKKDEVHHGQ